MIIFSVFTEELMGKFYWIIEPLISNVKSEKAQVITFVTNCDYWIM